MSEATTKAQPAAPVVSDEQIRKTVESIQDPGTVAAFHNGYYTLTPDELRRAILALRPAVEPMTPFTPSQRMRLWQNTEKGKSATSLGAFERICRTVEAAHRIGQESPQPAMPVVEAFAEGWKMAADWANRDDLLPDMDSPQYAKERDERLAELRPAVEPMTPEKMRKAAMDEMSKIPALANHHSWKGWPGTWAFATAAVNGITAKAEGGA